MKSVDPQEIYEFDFSFFVVSRFVPKLRRFKKTWSAQYIFDCLQLGPATGLGHLQERTYVHVALRHPS